ELPSDDAAAIDRLLESRPEVGVFLSRAWLSGFFAEPPPGVQQPLLVVFRAARKICGLATVGIQPAGASVHVSLLGGARGSDRVDLVAARGFERACADAFVSWANVEFGKRALILELRDVPAESPI